MGAARGTDLSTEPYTREVFDLRRAASEFALNRVASWMTAPQRRLHLTAGLVHSHSRFIDAKDRASEILYKDFVRGLRQVCTSNPKLLEVSNAAPLKRPPIPKH